jgi:methylenetetrahydrofolate--tRNA-(uracil-5-)-methyltransferase
MKPQAAIIGAGLAGSEAAWQLASRGVSVKLYEMRPKTMTEAHKTGLCAELVCSNSLRGASLGNAVGLLKQELSLLSSLFMESALLTQVPAGGALAVDRQRFSLLIDRKIRTHPEIEFIEEELSEIPEPSTLRPVIIASGPLTSARLSASIAAFLGHNHLAFYDAISPIVLKESIDLGVCFFQSRYDKGDGADYINVPLSKDEYYGFVEAVKRAQKHVPHLAEDLSAEHKLCPFEGCMPIEDMVERGADTLLFGPLKPVGLRDPRTGARPYAVLQLRQDDSSGALWNMVGMQTRMTKEEQLSVFRSLPGLEHAEFVRLGSVHRNTFINSPKVLSPTLEAREQAGLFFAGQITGTEGYVESAAGGLLAGINAARLAAGDIPVSAPKDTALGALIAYISDPAREDFQPMNISFGLMPNYTEGEFSRAKMKRVSKKERRIRAAERALESIKAFSLELEGP